MHLVVPVEPERAVVLHHREGPFYLKSLQHTLSQQVTALPELTVAVYGS